MKMILGRDYVHASTLGHVVRFIKNEPVHVPPIVVKECAAFGAVPVDTEVDVLAPEPEAAPQPVDPQARLEEVKNAIEKMVEENMRDDFTATGIPKVPAVSKRAGFKVDRTEVIRVWEDRHVEE